MVLYETLCRTRLSWLASQAYAQAVLPTSSPDESRLSGETLSTSKPRLSHLLISSGLPAGCPTPRSPCSSAPERPLGLQKPQTAVSEIILDGLHLLFYVKMINSEHSQRKSAKPHLSISCRCLVDDSVLDGTQ